MSALSSLSRQLLLSPLLVTDYRNQTDRRGGPRTDPQRCAPARDKTPRPGEGSMMKKRMGYLKLREEVPLRIRGLEVRAYSKRGE